MINEDNIKKIDEAEKKLRQLESLKASSVTKADLYKNDLEKSKEELLKLGTTPENAKNKLQEIEDEMNKLLQEIESNLPMDLLEKNE